MGDDMMSRDRLNEIIQQSFLAAGAHAATPAVSDLLPAGRGRLTTPCRSRAGRAGCGHAVDTRSGRARRYGIRPRRRGSARRGRGRHAAGPVRARGPPDLIVGTSVGAINGAFVAADPTPSAVDRLRARVGGAASERGLRRVRAGPGGHRVRTRTHLHPREPLRQLLAAQLPVRPSPTCGCRSSASRPASSGPPSTGSPRGRSSRRCSRPARCPGCCRRSRSTASTTWTEDWCTASRSAGRSRSAPTDLRAARRPDRAAAAPAGRPWEVALVAFEIARRHRFAADMAAVPAGVTVHVLPTGDEARRRPATCGICATATSPGVPDRIDRAHAAAGGYLDRPSASADGAA